MTWRTSLRSRRRLAKGAALIALFTVGASGGGRSAGSDERVRAHQRGYLTDRLIRRATLLSSLVNPDNEYAKLRRAHYSSGDGADWDNLPAWNPRTAAARTLAHDPPPDDYVALSVGDEGRLPSPTELHALGQQAFFRYPAQLAPAGPALLSDAAVARYGLWSDAERGIGGLVWAEMADGSKRLAFSCATCHADVVDGRLIPGLSSGRLDVGRMIADTLAGQGGPPDIARNALAWGPGRVDVTTNNASVPERIADLRPVRWLEHLHYDATIRQRDPVDLAIRIETLIITAHAQAIRPPRMVSLALAQFIDDLAGDLPSGAGDRPGSSTFRRHCSGCHDGVGLTGAARPLAVVGTDPILGHSADRGTGMYRVPSLRGLGSRPSLLHDGAVPTVAALLDPARLDAGYRGGLRGPGPVSGHAFGLDLPLKERRALISYLERL